MRINWSSGLQCRAVYAHTGQALERDGERRWNLLHPRPEFWGRACILRVNEACTVLARRCSMEFHYDPETELYLTESSKVVGYVQFHQSTCDQFIVSIDRIAYACSEDFEKQEIMSYGEHDEFGNAKGKVVVVNCVLNTFYFNITNEHFVIKYKKGHFDSEDEKNEVLNLWKGLIDAHFRRFFKNIGRDGLGASVVFGARAKSTLFSERGE